jgi:hypothetical protein
MLAAFRGITNLVFDTEQYDHILGHHMDRQVLIQAIVFTHLCTHINYGLMDILALVVANNMAVHFSLP